VQRYTYFMASEVDSPGGRLRLALDLFATGEAMMRQNLKRRFPQADEAEIEARLSAWLSERPGAEAGDSAGRPVPWPRPRG
jgi:hypothetical protein